MEDDTITLTNRIPQSSALPAVLMLCAASALGTACGSITEAGPDAGEDLPDAGEDLPDSGSPPDGETFTLTVVRAGEGTGNHRLEQRCHRLRCDLHRGAGQRNSRYAGGHSGGDLGICRVVGRRMRLDRIMHLHDHGRHHD